jgi:hypothetical protein
MYAMASTMEVYGNYVSLSIENLATLGLPLYTR